MNIKLSYDADLYYFSKLFSDDEVSVFDWKKDKESEIDLLIFPGGEDVSPNYYNVDVQIKQELSKLCYFNKGRDAKEKKIFDAFMNKEIKVKKVLGICRGIQFINVMFGGVLYMDLNFYGLAHKEYHIIHHRYKSNLGFFSIVNSLHHQGVKSIGKYYDGNDIKVNYIAADMGGYVPEIVTWKNEQILGIQFHPEYYGECDDKTKFRSFVHSWIKGCPIVIKDIYKEIE